MAKGKTKRYVCASHRAVLAKCCIRCLCANIDVIFRLMERRRFLKRLHVELEEADENKKAKSASESDPVISLALHTCMYQ